MVMGGKPGSERYKEDRLQVVLAWEAEHNNRWVGLGEDTLPWTASTAARCWISARLKELATRVVHQQARYWHHLRLCHYLCHAALSVLDGGKQYSFKINNLFIVVFAITAQA